MKSFTHSAHYFVNIFVTFQYVYILNVMSKKDDGGGFNHARDLVASRKTFNKTFSLVIFFIFSNFHDLFLKICVLDLFSFFISIRLWYFIYL